MTGDAEKPVTSLIREDFIEFPLWEYATDTEDSGVQDETWVHPVKRKTIPKKAYSQIVATDFRTPSGKGLQGFMVVTTANTPVQILPGALFLNTYLVLPAVSRQIAIQENYPWSIEQRKKILKALGARESEVFPLQYQLRVPVTGDAIPRSGLVE